MERITKGAIIKVPQRIRHGVIHLLSETMVSTSHPSSYDKCY
ncbi:hypothetical protein AG1IA_05047 [Rhizoctonia solani AG-1 IA]|uniref:Uncharacterized protein n=1 Tax=Thanatephorus cucumeris (strain AG1-IA) TaxID=983506 RepID=L8WSH7_THACA|nr:hypothetical protein AG1IA_05047 [Rhizoctonia solani AG-1 IA]